MGDYDKMSIILFAVLSIVGMIIPILLLFSLGPIAGLIWIAIFVVSYFKLTENRSIFTYLFVLSAPSSILSLISLFVPTIGSPFVALFGVFISYFVLQGKGLLE